jgi:hypothetical protein
VVKPRSVAADVGEVGQTTATGTRCPRCSAAVRPGAPWCSQCYAPAGAPDPSTAEVPPASVADRTSPLPAPTGTWPCSACSQPNDLALPACAGCGTPFLAAVRDGAPTVVLPVVGDLLALSPARRVAVAVAVVLLFLLGSALLALLLA